MTDADHQVRLGVTRLDLTAPAEPGELLLDIEGPATAVAGQARAWALDQDRDRIAAVIDEAFAGGPPTSGFSATINKSASPLVLITWPWAPRPRRH